MVNSNVSFKFIIKKKLVAFCNFYHGKLLKRAGKKLIENV